MSLSSNRSYYGRLQATRFVLVLIASIHYVPYFYFIWRFFKQKEYERRTQRDREAESSTPSSTPRSFRNCRYKTYSLGRTLFAVVWFNLIIGGFFAFFTYVIPTLSIGSKELCTSSKFETRKSCQEVQYAGAGPMLIVFLPILFMLIFDTVGQTLIHGGCCANDRNNATGDFSKCSHLMKYLMPWRYGLMIIYGGIICYAKNLHVYIDMEENGEISPNSDDDTYSESNDTAEADEALLNYALRLRRAGYIALLVSLFLWFGNLLIRWRSARWPFASIVSIRAEARETSRDVGDDNIDLSGGSITYNSTIELGGAESEDKKTEMLEL